MHQATHTNADLVNRVGYSSPKLVPESQAARNCWHSPLAFVLGITAPHDHFIVWVTYLRVYLQIEYGTSSYTSASPSESAPKALTRDPKWGKHLIQLPHPEPQTWQVLLRLGVLSPISQPDFRVSNRHLLCHQRYSAYDGSLCIYWGRTLISAKYLWLF